MSEIISIENNHNKKSSWTIKNRDGRLKIELDDQKSSWTIKNRVGRSTEKKFAPPWFEIIL